MIRTARIVNFLGDAGNGRFGAKRVTLAFAEHRYEITAYAKQLSELDFLVEIVSALMGREIGLPIPEPVIATDGKSYWFASVDLKYPDLGRSMAIKDDALLDTPGNKAILQKLANWSEINYAIGFDEWIANGDRNVGNILLDSKGNFYLIDHNLAMRLPFSPESPIRNALLNIKLMFTADDEVGRQRIKNKIESMINAIDPSLPRNIADRLLVQFSQLDSEILLNMVDFLYQRLQYLTAITHQKIPTRQQSL